MLDIAVSYDKYRFLGNEFLTWLWYLIDTDADLRPLCKMECATLQLSVGNAITLENSLGDESVEKISIRGDDAGLEEGKYALKKGAVLTDINLILQMDENEWRFTIRGESMNITSLKTPPTEKAGGEDEMEGAVLEKIYLYEAVFKVIDTLFHLFIEKRISETWKTVDIPAIRSWVDL